MADYKFNCVFLWLLFSGVRVCGTTQRQHSYQIIFPDSADNPYVKLVGTIPHNLTSITVCFWVNIEVLKTNCSDIFSYSLPDGTVPIAAAACKDDKVEFYERNEYNETKVKYYLDANGDWVLSCNMKSLSHNSVVMLNSKIIRYGGKRTQHEFIVPITEFGTLYLGEQNGGFRGQISQFNVWDYFLTVSEVLEMASCKYKNEGNIISWSKASWEPAGGAIVAPVALPCKLSN